MAASSHRETVKVEWVKVAPDSECDEFETQCCVDKKP